MFAGASRQQPVPPTTTRTRRSGNRQPSPPPTAGPSTGIGSSSLGGGALFGNIGGRDKTGYPQQRAGAEQQREREREHREQHQHTGTSGAMELSEEQKAEINEAVSFPADITWSARVSRVYRTLTDKFISLVSSF